jgi:hypothetical protein
VCRRAGLLPVVAFAVYGLLDVVHAAGVFGGVAAVGSAEVADVCGSEELRGSWNQLRVAAVDLAMARAGLEAVTVRALSWNPFVIFRRPPPIVKDRWTFPGDWTAEEANALDVGAGRGEGAGGESGAAPGSADRPIAMPTQTMAPG